MGAVCDDEKGLKDSDDDGENDKTMYVRTFQQPRHPVPEARSSDLTNKSVFSPAGRPGETSIHDRSHTIIDLQSSIIGHPNSQESKNREEKNLKLTCNPLPHGPGYAYMSKPMIFTQTVCFELSDASRIHLACYAVETERMRAPQRLSLSLFIVR